MKTIKFDLQMGPKYVATADELRSQFTTQILDHFRNGVLANWLRTRPDLGGELAAVEKLPVDGEDKPTLLALCKTFGVDADEHTVEAALARAAGTPPPPSASLASKELRDGQVSGNLAPGREDKWRVDVAGPAWVQVEATGSVDIACMMEDARGRQFATDGTIERKQATSLAAILSRGTYYIRLKAVDDDAGAEYDLRFRQDQEVRTSDLAHRGDSTYPSDEATLAIKDLTNDPRREETSNSVYETIWQQDATLAPGCAHLWIVEIPDKVAQFRTMGSTDTMGRLLGPDGKVLRKDDNSGAGHNFRIDSPKPLSGEFAVLVEGASAQTSGDYRIRVGLKPAHSPGLVSRGIRIVWDEYSQPRNWRS